MVKSLWQNNDRIAPYARDSESPAVDNAQIQAISRSGKRTGKRKVAERVLLVVGALALLPTVATAVPYDYHGSAADVVEGVQTYAVSTLFGLGHYPGPSGSACSAAILPMNALFYYYKPLPMAYERCNRPTAANRPKVAQKNSLEISYLVGAT